MATKELRELEAVLGFRFGRAAALEQALTHASLRHEQKTAAQESEGALKIEDNERMEFLGDAIVGMVVAELLYRRYPELDEGELTRLRAALVSRRHLGQVGLGMDLGAYLRLGKAEERSGGRRKAVLLANCVEAVIAAVYVEGGLEAAAGCVDRLVVEPYLGALRGELETRRSIGDYKTALQELLQARRAAQPEYALKAESGPDHRKRFVVEVRVRLGEAAETREHGEASTKKRAEQEAARRAYERLTNVVALSPDAQLRSAQQPDWQGPNGRTQEDTGVSAGTAPAAKRRAPRVRVHRVAEGRSAQGKGRQEQQTAGNPVSEGVV